MFNFLLFFIFKQNVSFTYMSEGLINKRVLLLHGLTKSPRVFDKLINNLEQLGYYCFAPTLSGHRNNPPYSKEVCYHNYISELEEYMNYITVGGRYKVQVIGISFGSLLALKSLQKSRHLISKMVLISPSIEFRNLGTRTLLPLFGYIPGIISRHLGSILKSTVSVGNYNASSAYTVNSVSILSKLRREVLRSAENVDVPCLLIQSSYDHHINPYSLYVLKNKIFGDKAKIALRDWGRSHNILDSDDAISIISNFTSN